MTACVPGGRDGTVTMLAIADPQKKELTMDLISNLPSRQRDPVKSKGGLSRNPLARFRAAAKMMLILNKVIEHIINRKKAKKKRKKGELHDLLCTVS